ncbi:MAG: hypothetical protein LUQ22_07160 [Methanotrichaceae archaeon]|nr:hypothetical protein [Methanotrichaceae archaeon]
MRNARNYGISLGIIISALVLAANGYEVNLGVYVVSFDTPSQVTLVQPQSHDSGEFNGVPVDLYEQRIYWGSNGMTLTRYQLYQGIDSPFIYTKKINILAESGWPNNYENRGNHTTSKGIVDGRESMITIFDKNLTIAYFPIRTDIPEMLQVRIDDTKENAQKLLNSLTVSQG